MHLVSLLLLFLAVCAAPARALTIYKCTDAQGGIAYQGVPCAGGSNGAPVALRPEPVAAAPATVASPANAPSRSAATRARAPKMPRPRTPRETVVTVAPDASWECRAANGDVFYQYSPCPTAVAGEIEIRHEATRGRSAGRSATVAVSGRSIARTEACRRIHAPSASDRSGHERDEDVSTYERNLGRDPCR